MKRPAVFLAAEWRHLTMLNFEVDPLLLKRYLLSGTQLDSWRDKTFISVVGFRFLRTRVLGFPIPHHRHFDEVNLRFYVKRDADGGVRRGVVFIKEIVPRRMIAAVARRVYNENYIALPMRTRSTLRRQRSETARSRTPGVYSPDGTAFRPK